MHIRIIKLRITIHKTQEEVYKNLLSTSVLSLNLERRTTQYFHVNKYDKRNRTKSEGTWKPMLPQLCEHTVNN